ncbi:hypothetical protein HOH45_02665 [bacterium]|nr:hypothetical protein [bacterium]
MKNKNKLIIIALFTLHAGMAAQPLAKVSINSHDQQFKLSKYEKSISNQKQDGYDSTSSNQESDENGDSENGKLNTYYDSTKKTSDQVDSHSESESNTNYVESYDNEDDSANQNQNKNKSKIKHRKKNRSSYKNGNGYRDGYTYVKIKRFKRHSRRRPLFAFNSIFPTTFGRGYVNDSRSKRSRANERRNNGIGVSNVKIDKKLPEISEEQEESLNLLLDKYEDFTGNFQVSYGQSMDQNGEDGVTGKQGVLVFMAPNSYSQNGTSLSAFGLGVKVRDFVEGTDRLTSFQGFVNHKSATVFDDSVASFGIKLGMHTLMGESKNTGLLVGMAYKFYNLPSNYSFHAEYNGTVYNINTEDDEPMLESNVNSFFRVYISQLHLDIGGELNFTNIDEGTYFQQGFVRAGFRF